MDDPNILPRHGTALYNACEASNTDINSKLVLWDTLKKQERNHLKLRKHLYLDRNQTHGEHEIYKAEALRAKSVLTGKGKGSEPTEQPVKELTKKPSKETPGTTPLPTPEPVPEPTPEFTRAPTPELLPEPTPDTRTDSGAYVIGTYSRAYSGAYAWAYSVPTPEPTPELTPSDPTPEPTPEPTPDCEPLQSSYPCFLLSNCWIHLQYSWVMAFVQLLNDEMRNEKCILENIPVEVVVRIYLSFQKWVIAKWATSTFLPTLIPPKCRAPRNPKMDSCRSE